MELLKSAELFGKIALSVKHQSGPIQFCINDLAEGEVMLLIEFAEWYQAGSTLEEWITVKIILKLVEK